MRYDRVEGYEFFFIWVVGGTLIFSAFGCGVGQVAIHGGDAPLAREFYISRIFSVATRKGREGAHI